MSVYTFKDSQVIDKVTFNKAANGSVRAYLHVRPDVDATVIDEIKEYFTPPNSGMMHTPFTLNGQPTLEIRGLHAFRPETSFINDLKRHHWTKGQYHYQKDPSQSWREMFRKRTLQGAGALYAWGDASFFMYGMKGKSPLDMAAGVLYGAPTPVLWFYGNNDQSEFHVKDFAQQMASEFKKHVDALPPDCAMERILADHKKGLVRTTNDVLQRFPSEFMNLCYAGAGACILGAAYKHLKQLSKVGPSAEAIDEWIKGLSKTQPNITREAAAELAKKSMRRENYLNAAVGTTTMASGLFGTLVKEKNPDPDEPSAHGLAKVWEWVRERPLAITGAGLMVSTMIHAASTAIAWKGSNNKHKEAVFYRIMFVVSALAAELMVALSSKGHGEGVVTDTSVDDSAVSIAADLIVRQPKAMQNILIDQLGRVLGRNDMLAISDEEAIAKLRTEVEALRKNPWARPAKESLQEPASIPSTRLAESEESDIPVWQTRTDLRNGQPALGL